MRYRTPSHTVRLRRSLGALLMLSAFAPVAVLGAQTRRGTSPSASPDVPSVALDYSGVFDDACARRAKQPLDSALAAHIAATVPAYRTQWEARGPALLRANVAATGQPFSFREARPAIITCGLPSLSFPLMLNGQSFRRGRDLAGSDAGEMTILVNTLWHEITHRYVGDIIEQRPGQTTPLLTKYAGELPVVLTHLHLYALQEVVYKQLGLASEAELATNVERQLFNRAAFDRAHEIVAKEGAEAFVRELAREPRGK